MKEDFIVRLGQVYYARFIYIREIMQNNAKSLKKKQYQMKYQRILRIYFHLQRRSLMKSFIVSVVRYDGYHVSLEYASDVFSSIV